MFPKERKPLPMDKIGKVLAVVAGIAVIGLAIVFWPEKDAGPKVVERYKSHLNQTPVAFASDAIWIKGKEVSLADEKGAVVWVEFTTLKDQVIDDNYGGLERWCKKYGPRGFKVVTVFSGPIDTQREVQRFYLGKRTNTSVMYDPDGRSAKPYEITQYPYGMLINQEGKVVFESFRNMTASALKINETLKEGE